MFSSGPNYTKLKTNLKLAISRLKLLQKKKTELTEKNRREIADYIIAGKFERAKVRVEYIIREDYLVEALEIVEMYCDLLLARFGLISNMKDLDEGIAEAVSSLIWVAPRLQSDVQELKVISDLLTAKYGPSYGEACRLESIESISAKLKHKMSIQSPPKLLVEKYVIEIAKSYNVPYEPDPQVMAMEKGNDALLIDLSSNNPHNNMGGGFPQPPGFLGYPQPPPLPNLPLDPMTVPFAYPPLPNEKEMHGGPSAPPHTLSYAVPPKHDSQDPNTDHTDMSLPSYSFLYPNETAKDSTTDFQSEPQVEENKEDDSKDQISEDNLEDPEKPQPAPRLKLDGKTYDLPDLPSVPSFAFGKNEKENDDVDFDDLTKRFNALKKKP